MFANKIECLEIYICYAYCSKKFCTSTLWQKKVSGKDMPGSIAFCNKIRRNYYVPFPKTHFSKNPPCLTAFPEERFYKRND